MIVLDTDSISILQWQGEPAERLRRRMSESRRFLVGHDRDNVGRAEQGRDHTIGTIENDS